MYGWIFLSINSCSISSGLNHATNRGLSQQLAIAKITGSINYTIDSVVFINPILTQRVNIFNRKEFWEPSKLFPMMFLPKRQDYNFRLAIPDSLQSHVRYFSDSIDIENGVENFMFLSLLLRTKKKDVFAMQFYNLYTIREADLSLRVISREFDLYKVKKAMPNT